MSRREQHRAHVLVQIQILEGRLVVPDVARLLGLSVRHLRRLLAKARRRGLAALAHGNRGRASPRRTADAIRAHVLALARGVYAGVNDCQLTELLAERDALHLSRPAVQRLLRTAGKGAEQRRQRRELKAQGLTFSRSS